MNSESLVYIIAAIAVGFILLGMAAFMYDKVTKEIPPEDKDMSYLAAQRKLTSVFNAPLKYLIENLKKHEYLSLIPFSLYIMFLIYEIILITQVIKLQ